MSSIMHEMNEKLLTRFDSRVTAVTGFDPDTSSKKRRNSTFSESFFGWRGRLYGLGILKPHTTKHTTMAYKPKAVSLFLLK